MNVLPYWLRSSRPAAGKSFFNKKVEILLKGTRSIMSKKRMLALIFLLVTTFLKAAVLLDAPNEIFIYNRQNREWSFPPVQANGRVAVEFRHRVDYPRPAGWCPCWQIEVNGHVLTSMGTRKQTRLLNKPFRWNHKYHGSYKADNQSDKWYSLYLQDYNSADNLFSPEHPEATRVVLDISDVVKADATNVIRIRFGGVSESFYKLGKVLDRKPALAVKDFKVSQTSGASTLKPIEQAAFRVTIKPQKNPDFEVSAENGQLLVIVKGEKIPVISRFSVPGGTWVELGADKALTTKNYKISRKYVKRANRLDFFDTITSASDSLIGLKIQYGTHLGNFEPVYVSGDSNPSAEEFAGGRNPSVFGSMPEKKLGIAFVAVDDVFRVQNISRCSDTFFNIGSDTFALSPGESRVVEWSLYPTDSPDYFDFVNAVRRDWDVNFPIAGCFNLSMNVYIRWDKEGAQRRTRNMGLGMNTFGVHFWSHMARINPKYKNYADCVWGVPRGGQPVRVLLNDNSVIVEDPIAINDFIKICIAKARDFTPEVKILSYIHNQISVKADDDKYDDCRAIDEKGKKCTYGQKKHRKLFIPTLENAWGKIFMDDIEWFLTNFDLDGIYWDEMNHTNTRTYYGNSMWDKVSVELDEHFNVKRKMSYVSLLKLPFTLKCIEKIMVEHNKMLVGNFSPETRSELRHHFPRFEETYSSRWIALSHLYTPIQLGDMLTYDNTPEDMAADMRNALFRGALYYHYLGSTGCPSLSSKMFPFTPRELHAGWLLGEERILTALSGDFGWYGENRLAETFVFDDRGREIPNFPNQTVGTEEGTRIKLDLNKNHCAAMVAIPIEALLKGVVLENIRYENGVMSCSAEGKGIVILKSKKRTQTFKIDGKQKIRF